MYHRMYLRRCSMSSISEESEMDEDDEFMGHSNQQQNELPNNLNVENCLGDLNNFKEVNCFFFVWLTRLLLRHVYSNVYFPPGVINFSPPNDLECFIEIIHLLNIRQAKVILFHMSINTIWKINIYSYAISIIGNSRSLWRIIHIRKTSSK